MKKAFATLSIILLSILSLSAKTDEENIWKIYGILETSGLNPDQISNSGFSSLDSEGIQTNESLDIEDFSTFKLMDHRHENQGFAQRDIYSFKDEYGQTGKIVFHKDPTNSERFKRHVIFVLFDNSEKGRAFICEKPEAREVDDEENNTVEITDYAELEEEEVEEEEEEPIPFVMVEEKPSFMGGDANKFSKWVNLHLVYPEKAKAAGIQGRVTTQFTVGKDGKVKDVKVVRRVDPSLDAEAVRVISMSPAWTPGVQRGKAVPVVYTFPVIFKLR